MLSLQTLTDAVLKRRPFLDAADSMLNSGSPDSSTHTRSQTDLSDLQAQNLELERQLRECRELLQQKEDERRRSEVRLSAIVDSAIASITSLRMLPDRTWEYDYISDGCERVFGYPPQAFMTDTHLWMSSVLPEDQNTVREVFRSIFDAGTAVVEYRFQHRDGTIRWISETLTSRWDEVDGCWLVTIVSLDVSEHKQVEVALHHSHQQIHNVLTSISDAFFSVDREWQFTFLNQQAEQILRREASQLLGRKIWEVFPDTIDSEFYHQCHWAMEHQQSVAFEAYYAPFDLWLDVRAYPFETGLSVYLQDISDRKQATFEAQRLQNRLEFLLSNAPVALFTCEPSGTYGATFMSENVRTIVGYEPQDFLNDSNFWASRIHPEDAPRIFDGLSLLFEQGHHTHDYRFLRKDGSYRWMRNDMKLIRDEDGNPSEIVGYFADIEDYKQTELALRESEQRLRTILERSPLSIFIKDTEGRYTVANRAYEQMTQQSREQILGNTDREVLPNLVVGGCQTSDEKALSQDEPIVFEERVPFATGARDLLITKFRLCNTLGEPYAVCGIAVDMTDRIWAEHALRQSEQFLRSIYNNTQISFFIADVSEDGNFYFVDLNPVHQRLTGISTADIQGKTLEQIFPPEVASEVRQHYSDCVVAGQSITYEECVPFQGRDMWWITTLTPLYDSDARIVRLLGSCLNITDRIQEERERERQRQKSQILAGITLKIRQSLDLENILQTTVEEVQQWLSADRVFVYRFSPDWSGLITNEAAGSPDLSILGQIIYDPCLARDWVDRYEQGHITNIPDLSQADLQDCHREFMQRFSVQANLVVPLLQDRHLWGLLIAHQCAAPREWTADEMSLLQQLSAQVSIAIQQAKLFQQLQFELEERQRAETALQQLNQQLEQRVQQRTEQLQQSQVALQQREQEIRTLVENSPDVIARFDSELRYLYINSVITQRTGLPPSAFIHRKMGEAGMPPGYAAQCEAAMLRAFQTGIEQIIEVEFLTPQKGRWLRNRFIPERNLSGEVVTLLKISEDITDRKQAEEAIRVSEERLRLALTAANQGLYDLNVKTGEAIVSPEYAKMLGYDPETFHETNAKWIARLHPDDIDRVANVYQAYIRGELPDYKVEFRQRTKNGGWKWILSLGKIVEWDADGHPLRMIGTHTDTSDRKQVENDLQESRNMLKLVLDTIPQRVFWKDRDSRFLGCNSTFAQDYQLGCEEIVGKTDLESPWSRFARRYRADDAVVMRTRTPKLNYEEPISTLSGEQKWIRTSKIPLTNSQGELIGILGCYDDISDRKQAEQQLRSKSLRLELALEAANMGTWELTMEDGSWSERTEAIFGYAPGTLPGGRRHFLKQIHRDDRKRVFAALNHSFTSRSLYNVEHRIECLDGEVRWVAVSGKVVETEDGAGLRMVGVVLDITKRKQAEAQIQLALQEKETLLKEIHHRVKNNLQIVSALLSFQAETVQDARTLAALQDSESRLQAMSLIHETLYQSEDLGQLNFSSYIQRLVENILTASTTHQVPIQISYNLEPIYLNLETAIPCGLLLNELITNAVKHAFPSQQSGTIAITLQKMPLLEDSLSDPQYVLSIQDNGIGMVLPPDPQNLKSLGLKIAYDLAHQLRGTLELSVDDGTRFQLVFSELKYRKRF